jgi:hypothetical protein
LFGVRILAYSAICRDHVENLRKDPERDEILILEIGLFFGGVKLPRILCIKEVFILQCVNYLSEKFTTNFGMFFDNS